MASPLSRRQFVIASAAAAGATWFDLPRIFAAESKDGTYGGFPMGIQSYSLRGFGVDGALDHTQKLGLHWIEFFAAHFPPTLSEETIGQMNAKLKAHDLHISSHGVQGFGSNHEANRKFFQFAKMANIRNISADPTPDSFESLDKLVKEFDIRIAIHNHGPGARYDKPTDALKAVEKWDKRIGFCADLGHYIRSGFDPAKIVHELGDRLYGVHLKDFQDMKAQTKGVILGKGHMDVVAVFQALKDVKFPADGALSLEYEENPKDPIAEIKECLEVASAAARKVAAA